MTNKYPQCSLFSIFYMRPQDSKSLKYWANDEPGFMTAYFTVPRYC